jgi:hypothetical protein
LYWAEFDGIPSNNIEQFTDTNWANEIMP